MKYDQSNDLILLDLRRPKQRPAWVIEVRTWILVAILTFTIYSGFVAVRDWLGTVLAPVFQMVGL